MFLNKTLSYLQGATVCASVYSLFAISVDRFLGICCPMRWHLSSRGTRFLVTSIFSLSLTFYFRLVQTEIKIYSLVLMCGQQNIISNMASPCS
ncbi:hypothetical protein AVEN_109496-1 [Araneus ventricosus]|uniref:G-protein coupled receptors family 1 profile domain-containing protein n=1 Tax=Araneus ventricosus TaxID=182803 RepID=A0A4Y2TC80_ARAVE|nr:hypothetical protein AVEN_105832-1 [Araneus ventricosus]GBN98266.1 hypothetical protein AVEN_109496-1 [Araneus ventricosus]